MFCFVQTCSGFSHYIASALTYHHHRRGWVLFHLLDLLYLHCLLSYFLSILFLCNHFTFLSFSLAVSLLGWLFFWKKLSVPSDKLIDYCKFGNFRVTFISRFFYIRIISEFLNSRVSVHVFYKVYSDSLLAKTLNSRGNQFANISEN